ncbi:MAG: L,D-transpeptidase family protein [Candidatus Moraniibacteriota bacterium]
MSHTTFKTLSFFVAVLAGLIPAYFLVFGTRQLIDTRRLFGTVHASSIDNGPMNPSDAFMIGFSEPVDPGSLDGKISVSPDVPFRTVWNSNQTSVSVIPVGRWTPGGQYRVLIGEVKIGAMKTVPASAFSFQVSGYPAIVSTSPASGTKDIALDIEDPIVVAFDRSVKDFYVDFRVSPGIEVAYENNPEKTEFRILPKGKIQSETSYTLSVFVKWRDEPDSAYHELGKASFTTIAERPVTWEKDIALRAAQAKKYAHALRPEGKYIDIDLAIQIMTIFENGVALDAYPVSSGKPGMETPKGEYAIRNKTPRAWSAAYGLYMPYWMALVPDGKFGIHELPEWPGGYKEGANHLGVPVSHGCVRLGVGPAGHVYEWADIGTPVVVH